MTGNHNDASDILRVFKSIKENIMQTLNVCSIVKVVSHTNDYAKCELLNQPKVMIECYNGIESELENGKYYIALFTDEDSRSNIMRVNNGEEPIQIPNNEVRHNLNFGVIISKIRLGEDR